MTTPTKGKRGGFFVIEQRPFHAACALGMRPAVALLVMASFSDRAGTLTRASANAIEKRTEIGRKAAHDAIVDGHQVPREFDHDGRRGAGLAPVLAIG